MTTKEYTNKTMDDRLELSSRCKKSKNDFACMILICIHVVMYTHTSHHSHEARELVLSENINHVKCNVQMFHVL